MRLQMQMQMRMQRSGRPTASGARVVLAETGRQKTKVGRTGRYLGRQVRRAGYLQFASELPGAIQGNLGPSKSRLTVARNGVRLRQGSRARGFGGSRYNKFAAGQGTCPPVIRGPASTAERDPGRDTSPLHRQNEADRKEERADGRSAQRSAARLHDDGLALHCDVGILGSSVCQSGSSPDGGSVLLVMAPSVVAPSRPNNSLVPDIPSAELSVMGKGKGEERRSAPQDSPGVVQVTGGG
ncbi:hypothetical protein B0T19DRAFT_211486 [Cercophora scortea]|uniref:Uncharacterized protein n=1 Tax=Cercophora scortea TaxID=314031 RepID=A0AAE0IED2_9PEZI|nr:hypothetical protein B0T19DRAFT_211486 [Cercophora scortea]